MSVLGEGSIAQGITDLLTPAQGRAVIQYMLDQNQIYKNNPRAVNAGAKDNTGRNKI